VASAPLTCHQGRPEGGGTGGSEDVSTGRIKKFRCAEGLWCVNEHEGDRGVREKKRSEIGSRKNVEKESFAQNRRNQSENREGFEKPGNPREEKSNRIPRIR